MTSKRRSLAFVIHDLNPWGGHDRSTLEIARRLSHRWPVEVYAYQLIDPKGLEAWGDVRFHRIVPDLHRPAVARASWFHGVTLPLLGVFPKFRGVLGEPSPLIHATGTCTWVSDVVQVQYLSATWREKQKTLPEEVCAKPFSRGGRGPMPWIRRRYHDLLLDYNVMLEHRLYSQEKTYIAIAHSVARELRGFFGITKNVHVIHHGVDAEAFSPAQSEAQLDQRRALREKYGIAPDELVLLFVGAYERKGLSVAIDSLAHLSPESRRRVRLVAVGGGTVEGFQKKAREKGVEDRVLLVGHSKNIVDYYRAADLFVLPTLYEPFGLVILEALACGLPSIVSELAGASELIRDGVSGRLIRDPSDAAEVGQLLEALIADDEARGKMAVEARKVAVARSWDQVAEDYVTALGPLMEGGAGSA